MDFTQMAAAQNEERWKGFQSLPSSPTDYARNVQRMSQKSFWNTFYLGDCNRFAEFVNVAGSNHPHGQRSENFAWLYELNGHNRPSKTPFEDFCAQRNADASVHNHILFLSGYPSAQVLNEIGFRYGIEPAFFDKHLCFMGDDPVSCTVHPPYHILPSRQQTIIQTSVTSIGGVHRDSGYTTLQAKREAVSSGMRDYMNRLKLGLNWNTHHSIVRGVEVHDADRFSLEQYLTIIIAKNRRHPKKWIVIVWSDAGADLCDSPPGPWLDSPDAHVRTHFRPVSLYNPDVAFLGHKSRPERLESHSSGARSTLPNSLRLLPKSYGEGLDFVEIARDPIYSLYEVFCFLATSEAQFLDMILSVLENSIAKQHASPSKQQADARAILIHSYRDLERHHTRILAISRFLQSREQIDTNGQQQRSTAAHSALSRVHQDFEYLSQSAERLMAKCDHELSVIMNEIGVGEARRGISQSNRQYKFIVLAAIYVPLTFSCSLFGMNFVTIDDVKKGFKIWIIVTIPVFLLSFLIMTWDIHSIPPWGKKIIESINKFLHI